MIEISIVDDDIVEYLELFNVILLRATNGATLGKDVQVTVTIPPNDSPVGVFGFEEKHVSTKRVIHLRILLWHYLCSYCNQLFL